MSIHNVLSFTGIAPQDLEARSESLNSKIAVLTTPQGVLCNLILGFSDRARDKTASSSPHQFNLPRLLVR